MERKQQKQNLQSHKKTREASSKTKSTKEKIISDPKAPKTATRSSSRLNSLPKKIKNYSSEQDEDNLSSKETDDVFDLGKIRRR